MTAAGGSAEAGLVMMLAAEAAAVAEALGPHRGQQAGWGRVGAHLQPADWRRRGLRRSAAEAIAVAVAPVRKSLQWFERACVRWRGSYREPLKRGLAVEVRVAAAPSEEKAAAPGSYVPCSNSAIVVQSKWGGPSMPCGKEGAKHTVALISGVGLSP